MLGRADHHDAPAQARNPATGVATMCIGFGQGVATVFERA